MPKIELRESKILKLINVLSREVPETELFSHDKQITMLNNWIKAKGYDIQGPLIMYSGGVIGSKDGRPLINNRIMFQLKQSSVRTEKS